jgi:hypothetical protein
MLEATQRRCPQFDAIQVVVEVLKHLYRLGDNGFFLLLLHHGRDSISSWDVLLPYDKSFFQSLVPNGAAGKILFMGARATLLPSRSYRTLPLSSTARCHPDKDADAQCHRNGDERTLFGLLGNLAQRCGSVPGRIFAESCRLIAERV